MQSRVPGAWARFRSAIWPPWPGTSRGRASHPARSPRSRNLHRLRCARHPAHPHRDAPPQLQKSLVRSHAAGSGPEVEREVVRALMLLRLSTLATGHTGVRRRPPSGGRPAHPRHHPGGAEYGSLGCSGDLAPLAHCALALMGEGEVRDAAGRCCPPPTRSAAAGLAPVELPPRRGWRSSTAPTGCSACWCWPSPTCASCCGRRTSPPRCRSRGSSARTGFRPEPAGDAPAPRPGRVGRQPVALLGGSGSSPRTAGRTATASRTPTRCAARRRCTAPPATPSSTPARGRARARRPRSTTRCAGRDGRVESNGNFHGAPVAYVLDFLAIVAADVASISERRTDRFLDKARNHGLPPFLADDPGVDSGHMIAQYTQAAIVSELKRLADPASVDSIPSARCRRTTSRWAGRRAQAAPLRRRPDAGRRDRGPHRGPRPRPARAAAPSPPPAPSSPAARSRASRAPAPTATSRPRSRPPSPSSRAVLAAVEDVIGELAC